MKPSHALFILAAIAIVWFASARGGDLYGEKELANFTWNAGELHGDSLSVYTAEDTLVFGARTFRVKMIVDSADVLIKFAPQANFSNWLKLPAFTQYDFVGAEFDTLFYVTTADSADLQVFWTEF